MPTPGTILVQEQWEETIGPGTIPEIEMTFSLRWRFHPVHRADPKNNNDVPDPSQGRAGRADTQGGVPVGDTVQGDVGFGAVQGSHQKAVVPRPRRTVKPKPRCL